MHKQYLLLFWIKQNNYNCGGSLQTLVYNQEGDEFHLIKLQIMFLGVIVYQTKLF